MPSIHGCRRSGTDASQRRGRDRRRDRVVRWLAGGVPSGNRRCREADGSPAVAAESGPVYDIGPDR